MSTRKELSAILCADWGKERSKRAVYVADVESRVVRRLSAAGWSVAGVLYVWPRLAGAPLAHFRLANWGFWLITLGIGAMALVLSAQGLQQGFMLMAQSEFLETVTSMRPYWWVRTFTGISMDIGMSLVVYTLLKGSLARRSA